jgi:hypothetical protein
VTWEYKTWVVYSIENDQELDHRLCQLGKDGWGLVGLQDGIGTWTLFFKRPSQPPPPPISWRFEGGRAYVSEW